MNYKVKDLLDKNKLVSHLFLDCVSDSVDGTDVVKAITRQDGYDIDTTEVDIKLTFNGMEVNIDKFLEQFEKQYDKIVEKGVDKKFDSLFPSLDYGDFCELEQSVNDLVENFRKKIIEKYKKD